MDELLAVLNGQLKSHKYILLHDKRVKAYKFLNSAYNYVDCRACVSDDFDSWEQQLLFNFNHLTGLSRKSNRDQLLAQIADTRYIVSQRIEFNPHITEGENKLFEMVESFRVEA